MVEGISDRLCQRGATGDAAKLSGQPDVHRLDERAAALLTRLAALVDGLAADVGFDRIKCGDLP